MNTFEDALGNAKSRPDVASVRSSKFTDRCDELVPLRVVEKTMLDLHMAAVYKTKVDNILHVVCGFGSNEENEVVVCIVSDSRADTEPSTFRALTIDDLSNEQKRSSVPLPMFQ